MLKALYVFAVSFSLVFTASCLVCIALLGFPSYPAGEPTFPTGKYLDEHGQVFIAGEVVGTIEEIQALKPGANIPWNLLGVFTSEGLDKFLDEADVESARLIVTPVPLNEGRQMSPRRTDYAKEGSPRNEI